MIGDNYQRISPFDRWIFDASGNLAGASASNRSSKEARFLTPEQASAVQASLSGAVNAIVADQSANTARVQGVYYPLNDGSGSTLAEQGADGPAISVGGTVTGAWANAGYFTHDAAGNTIKIANNQYIDGLISMQTECSIIIGCDLYITAWPSSTESIWALHRDDLSGGGVRFPMASASAGRFGVYYKPSGGATTEQVGYVMGSYLNQRISTLTELRVRPTRNEMNIYMYINGRMQRSNVVTLGTPPATDSTGGLYLSGYGSTPLQKLGSGGSGARTALFYALRHSGEDRNIAGRLAAYVAANQALPSWLTRI